MKKYLLSLFVFGTIYCFGQNNNLCPSCSNGANYGPHHAITPNGNSTLGLSYVLQNVCGLNYVQGTTETETRSTPFAFNPGTGFPTTVAIAGLPAGFVLQKAFVYYGCSYTEATPPATNVSITNPALVNSVIASTMIGSGGDVCWGTTGTCGYRCDVTAAISGNGTYTINLTGFANAAYEVDGVTLIIIYVNPTATYSGNIALWDGNMWNSTGSPMTYTGTGFTACTASSAGSSFGLFGDIQSNVNGNQNTDNFNGSIATFSNNFWQCNVINTNVAACQSSAVFTGYTNNLNDCWMWNMQGLYWQYSTCAACNVMTVSLADVNPSCGACNGSITATVVGGSAPFTYAWTPGGQTTATITGLCAGSYTVNVHDACGNTATASVTLTGSNIAVTANNTGNEPCNGSCVGSANVTIVGGSAPYTYAWTPSGGTLSSATGLCAGNYTITVTDHAGCTGTATVTITQPTAVTGTFTSTGVLCNGGSTGTATVIPAGGTPGYHYSWSTIPPQTNATATGLSAGTYTVTITDANGCTGTASVAITQPPLLTANMGVPANILCNGGLGNATVTAAGGTPAYTYSWAPNGGSNAMGTGLTAGSYTVTVKDKNGCTATASVTITQPPLLTATMGLATNASCNGGLGSVTVTPGGGTPNYTYLWNPGGNTNANATNLTAGSYTVTVKDANGCTATASVTITQPTPLSVTTTFTHASCNLPNGTATATVIGGTPTYTYTWTPVGGTNALATGISAGSYTITVTDHNGCTASASVTVTQPSAVTASIMATTGVSCNGGNNGTATASAVGGTGPYTYSWAPVGGNTNIATGLSAGTYTVTITDNNGCSSTASATITQPTLLTATMGVPTYPACNGQTGSATVTAGGGNAPYTYLWNPGGNTNATATNLTAGSYTVTVKDHNGCIATASVTITQPTLLTAAIIASTNVACNGGTGSATVAAGGGTPNYSYLWNPGGNINANATNLSAGSYTVTVKDANGCTATASVTITQPLVLSTTATFTHASCNLPNGTATANPAGGTNPYAYVWSPSAQTNATATGLNVGTYTVTVTDAHGCTATTPVNVTQPSAVTASISGTTAVSCHGGNNGTATAIAGGGSAPYNYIWAPGGNTNAAGTGLAAGTYTMTVTDANGCTSTAAATITEPTTIVLTATGPGLLCRGSAGNFTANASGGTLPYNYLWSSGATTSVASITPTGPQTYSVTVTDANGCTATAEVAINFGPPLTITASGQNSICTGASATICATATGGTGGNTFLWTPSNQTTGCITVSPSSTTTYTVTVTDNCGAQGSSIATVNVNQLPAVNMTADIYVGCAPLCIQFRNASQNSPGGVIQYVWSFGNGDTVQTESPIYCYPNSGKFDVTLTVSDSAGCSATMKKSDMITVYTKPIAAFTYSPQAISTLNATVQFMDQSKDKYGLVSWLWSFGDATDSTSKHENASHTYQDSGSFCTNLIVMNEHGCTDTTTNCMVVVPAYSLYIPSAFSPNGDGVNDIFQPVGKYIKNFEMYIFDRWGMQLYHTTDITRGWKGNVGSGTNIAQEDTYVYKIIVTDAVGVQHSYVGNVSIIK